MGLTQHNKNSSHDLDSSVLFSTTLVFFYGGIAWESFLLRS